jgi:hypothetical protein
LRKYATPLTEGASCGCEDHRRRKALCCSLSGRTGRLVLLLLLLVLGEHLHPLNTFGAGVRSAHTPAPKPL